MSEMTKARERWAREDAEREEKVVKELAKADGKERAQPGHDANRDPISGEPGAHPLGTGAGAATGAVAGAAVGTVVGGPVGFALGGAVGAVVGGLAGSGAAEGVNPTVEDAYWHDHYKKRPYAKSTIAYAVYRPAYRYGWESRALYAGRPWEDLESELQSGWVKTNGQSTLAWEEARLAARDAWDRVDQH